MGPVARDPLCRLAAVKMVRHRRPVVRGGAGRLGGVKVAAVTRWLGATGLVAVASVLGACGDDTTGAREARGSQTQSSQLLAGDWTLDLDATLAQLEVEERNREFVAGLLTSTRQGMQVRTDGLVLFTHVAGSDSEEAKTGEFRLRPKEGGFELQPAPGTLWGVPRGIQIVNDGRILVTKNGKPEVVFRRR